MIAHTCSQEWRLANSYGEETVSVQEMDSAETGFGSGFILWTGSVLHRAERAVAVCAELGTSLLGIGTS